MTFSMFVSGIVIAFVYGWQLALVLIGVYPLIFISARFLGIASTRGVETTKKAYQKCGGLADEAISEIRTVCAFCAEEYETSKYLQELSFSQEVGIQNALYIGLAMGFMHMANDLSWGIGLFVGSFFAEYRIWNNTYNKPYDAATILIVFFSGFMAMNSLGMLLPIISSVREAQIAAYEIHETIDSVADKKKEEEGKIIIPPEKFLGRIEFKNVSFRYPSRPNVDVLTNFSMVFEPGQMTGICGQTGSGKSTIIQLIERFYKPNEGKIEVDGIDINTLDLKWWRGNIGYVGQEPVLFNTTIKSNILYGNENAKPEEVEMAASQANCTGFINAQKQGFDTSTGIGGAQLSGGQKQRVAIARALIRKPKIILLDEATSALDLASEQKVQESFNKIQAETKMSIIVIAHRLSTIKNSNKIIVLKDGSLQEVGTDQQLRQNSSIYANLCKLQEFEIQTTGSISTKEMETGKNSVGRKKSEHAENDNQIALPEKKEEIEISEEKKENYLSQIWAENWKHKTELIVAISIAVLSGYHQPAIGIVFGAVSIDFLNPNPNDLRKNCNLDFAGYMICAGTIVFIMIGMFWYLGSVAAKVTYNLRKKLYEHFFKMDIGWFDSPNNAPYALGNILTEGAEEINGFVKNSCGTMIQCASFMVFAVAVAFGLSWRIALIALACIPFMSLSGYITARYQQGFAKQNKELYMESIGILSEVVKNFRTVASFCSEGKVLKMFKDSLAAPLAILQYKALVAGLLYGVSNSLPFLVYAALFYFMALFNKYYNDNPKYAFMAMYALILSALAIGNLQQYAPDMGKASASLVSIFSITETKPKVVSLSNRKDDIKGKIEFQNVCFKYPTREEQVLKDLNMVIEAGQKIAIVGVSGSGKSTITQLLERFYDPDSGKILIDGIDIKEYDLHALRNSIGLVSQEPVLFDASIEDNIKYGCQSATEKEVIEACNIAEATTFINEEEKDMKPSEVVIQIDKDAIDNGKGLKRKVGSKGKSLSGGEKQRLAIARAVIKKPKIFVFDEATSALDSNTEKLVQNSLYKMFADKTSIVIAHRLGTIREDDTVFVLEKGKIVEIGKKAELLEKKGCFFKLYGNAMS